MIICKYSCCSCERHLWVRIGALRLPTCVFSKSAVVRNGEHPRYGHPEVFVRKELTSSGYESVPRIVGLWHDVSTYHVIRDG